MGGNPLQILMVEDVKHDYLMARRALERSDLDFQVTWVQRGKEALTRLQSRVYDVVLIDFGLPGLSGLETFRQMLAQGLDLPVVFVTGTGSAPIAVEALKLGALDYLVKDTAGEHLRLLPVVVRKARDQWESEQSRRRAKAELRQYVADLEKRNAELDAFAHTVAHDLKGPLANIIGFASLSRELYAEMREEELQECLLNIKESGFKMNRIIDALLLLAKLRKEEVEINPLDMAGIVAEVQQRLTDEVTKHQAEVVLPDTWPQAYAYGPWIEEVWANYLSNAIKYGGRPPLVELGSAVQPDNMSRFWIRDNGLGIPPDKQSALFTPFTQLSQVRNRGYGLGLSIVQRIIEKCGGEVGADSQVGQGSTFWFTLPLAT